MPRPAPLALAALLLAAPLLASPLLDAQSLAQPSPSARTLAEEGEDIPYAEWRAMTAGRTVWYLIEGDVWGRESYRAGGDQLVFQFPDGQCLPATWSHEDPWFCFDFRDAMPEPLHCFRHIRWQGGIWVLGDQGAVQQVDRIDDAPVACGPNVSS